MTLSKAAEIFRKLDACENRVYEECIKLDDADCEHCEYFVDDDEEKEAKAVAIRALEACDKLLEGMHI